MTWLENSLSERGFLIDIDEGNSQAADASCKLDLILRRAETMSQSTNLGGTIVIEVSDEDRSLRRVVRGQRTAMNWASGSGEINVILSKALNAALDQVVEVCPS